MVELIRRSSYFIGFTGAGISTSAGIPDYRSGADTVLETGPGKWVTEETSKLSMEEYASMPSKFKRKDTVSAEPTYTHFALTTLLEEGILKHIISQNIDGLHMRSGTKLEQISELHGNTFLEVCSNCGADYFRPFRCRNPKNPYNVHLTGRFCTNCNTELKDTIVNFNESLPVNAIHQAKYHTSKADVCLCLGSSLQVKPAMLFPLAIAKKGHLAIVNLQPTPLDQMAQLRIWAKIDDVMKLVMKKLGHDF